MNTQKIEDCWNALKAYHGEIGVSFYSTLLRRYPQYQEFFTEETLESQKNKIIQTVALVCKFADDKNAISPHIQQLGKAHTFLNLTETDLENFTNTLVDTIAEYAERHYPEWKTEDKTCWLSAFNNVVKPVMVGAM